MPAVLLNIICFKEKFGGVKRSEHLFRGPVDLTIYFHRKDSHYLAFDWSDQGRSEISHVFVQERDFSQLRVILGGIHFTDPTNRHLRLDDATHCRLESHWIVSGAVLFLSDFSISSSVLFWEEKEGTSGYWRCFLGNDPVDGAVEGVLAVSCVILTSTSISLLWDCSSHCEILQSDRKVLPRSQKTRN